MKGEIFKHFVRFLLKVFCGHFTLFTCFAFESKNVPMGENSGHEYCAKIIQGCIFIELYFCLIIFICGTIFYFGTYSATINTRLHT